MIPEGSFNRNSFRAVLSCGALLLGLVGLFGLREAGASEMPGYKLYNGSDLGYSVSFRYPADWELTAETGKIDKFNQIRILGPRNAEETFRFALVIRSTPTKAYGGVFESSEALMADYREKLYKDASVDREQSEHFGDLGLKAEELTVSYTIPPIHQTGLKGLPVPVKATTLFAERETHLLEVSYSGDARQYDDYLQAFEQLKESFKFIVGAGSDT